MPRTARKKSEYGYYHLITRGNGSQILFADRSDRIKYLNLIKENSREFLIQINAFCLMDNHVHLLVHDENGNISAFMKKTNGRYVAYFNKKYVQNGHLFQDRYKSEPIETAAYLMTVLRYILNNPRKAGISTAEKYEWSSYNRYGKEGSFVNTDVFRDLIGNYDEYAAFIAAPNSDECMEYNNSAKDDEWALNIIRENLKIPGGTMLRTWPEAKRNEALRLLKKKGLTIRQIERVTGINRGIIQKA